MEKVGPYVIIGRLATGGMAEVFLARRDGPAGFEKIQVVKRILPQFAEDPEFRRMFLDEARLAALINHPNVVQIFELGGTRELLYIAMEYVPGFDLAKVMDQSLKQRRLVPPSVAARVVADAAAGLDFAHRLTDARGAPRGIVHRDISPENLLVSEVGQVKVVDFGIARANTGTQLSASGRLKGKVHYHAPEHIQNQPVDGKADVYALGVVLYELLCARRPFEGQGELEVMRSTVEVDPPPPSSWYPAAQPELSEIALRALARDRRKRPTAAELRDALELWLRGNPCTAADIERYLLEVIPATSPERTKPRKLLEQAPEREPSQTDPTRLPPPGLRPPGPDEHTVRERVLRPKVLIPVGIAALVAFAAVGWALWRKPAAAPVQVAVVPVAPAPSEVPVPPPDLAPKKAVAPAPPQAHEREHEAKRAAPHREMAELTVRAHPRCELFVDAERTSRPLSRALSLAPGAHTLHFVNHALHLDAVRTVHLAAGERTTQQFTFSSRPIAVRISPWAYVTVDDEKYGATPMLNRKLQLYEGTHRVALRYGTHTARVEFKVTAAGENELRYSFSK